VNEGLGVRVYGVPSARPAGTVVAQSPRGGHRARTGTYVRINVAVN
jgi:beta-lactam-binding protein with PASTA domain